MSIGEGAGRGGHKRLRRRHLPIAGGGGSHRSLLGACSLRPAPPRPARPSVHPLHLRFSYLHQFISAQFRQILYRASIQNFSLRPINSSRCDADGDGTEAALNVLRRGSPPSHAHPPLATLSHFAQALASSASSPRVPLGIAVVRRRVLHRAEAPDSVRRLSRPL